MAAQTVKSKLVTKLGNKIKAAITTHAADETDYGFVALPPGITNGVAQLTNVYFDEYKSGDVKGELYMRAVGVVLEPESVQVNGQTVPVKGLQTSLMVGLVAKPAKGERPAVTIDQCVADVMNEFRKLGADTSVAKEASDLEAIAQALTDAKPFFRFSTRESKEVLNADKTVKYAARTWESWNGNKGLEDYVAPEAGGVSDSSGDTDTQTSGSGDGGNDSGASTSSASGDEWDIDTLVETAKGEGDPASDAQNKLIEIADGLGKKDEAEAADATWDDVGQLIKDAQATSSAEGAEFKPNTGDVYKYQQVDAKGKPVLDAKKKPVKPIEVEIMMVTEKDRTVTVKNLETGKPLLGADKKGLKISWDALIRE